ncbi:MAG: imidazole glycerol phosphate synthase subunit HisH, partial [Allosphingosinicella sp.]
IAIVDLGCGNVGSVDFALRRLGADTKITDDPARIDAAERVLLPGVGAAGHAMARIDELGLRETLQRRDRPMLGICLGMQLLFDESEEDETRCLGLIEGKVRQLDFAPGRPVPHMGWSRLAVTRDDMGLGTGDYVYFAHSFACDDGPHTVAAAEYGRTIPAAVRKDRLFGAQFHPERSSQAGTRFLQAFLSC